MSEQNEIAPGVSLRQVIERGVTTMQHVVMVIGMLRASRVPAIDPVVLLGGRAVSASSMAVHLVAIWDATTPTFTPTAGAPGSAAVQKLLDWGGWFALAASLGGLIIGAGMWAHSSTSGSYGGVHRGKQYVLGGAIGALVLGVAPLLISTLFTTGKS
jgi:hypothetical protein